MKPPDNVSHTLLTIGGHRLHTMRSGGGSVVPLLMIMGLGGNCDMWTPLLPHLGERTVIAFDAPGTGRSSTPAWPVSMPALADIAVAVLDHYRLEQVDVLGYSYGGAVAQQLAANHSSRVRRLVLAATTMGAGSTAGSPEATQELATPLRYYMPGLFERTAAKVYGGKVGRSAELRTAMASARSEHQPTPYGYALQLAGGWGWSSREFASRIPHPTLVLGGDDDPLVPIENVRELADAIPDAVVHVVAGAGHLLLMDEAGQVAPVILDFLDRPDANPHRGARTQDDPDQERHRK